MLSTRIVITTGEPAGVGPELAIQVLPQALTHWPQAHFTLLGDAALLAQRAVAVGADWQNIVAQARINVCNEPLRAPCTVGVLNPANGDYVLALLDRALAGVQQGCYDAMVTAPLQKSALSSADLAFTGHTEYLAAKTATPNVVMMLAGPGIKPLRVALATTHIPLKDVALALSQDGLLTTLRILDQGLRQYFGLGAPCILVTGLNPHAGEQGCLGREEIELIIPALRQAQAVGIDARGPYPADTLFQPHYLAQADCVLAMFHDQGLPVLKYATFGMGVNITLGLPVIRTSVDHGTALALAGSGRAQQGSMLAAIETALTMAACARVPAQVG